jgi:DNA invertase Pin-like site-specific DNA recombinase
MVKVTKIPAKKQIHSSGANTLRKLNVCAYARVSTDKEAQEQSYEAQYEFYTNKIQREPLWNFVGMYGDDGISGLTADQRPEFQRMVNDAFDGKIDLILCKNLSRFSRNTMDVLTYTRKLKEHNTRVLFEAESIDTFAQTGETMLTIFASLAQDFSRNMSENVKWGKEQGYQRGVVCIPCETFLGYRKNADGEIEIDSKQAEVVEKIYDLFLMGNTCTGIAKHLTEIGAITPIPAGKTTKRGTTTGKWHVATVESILQNEKYKGCHVYRKNYVPNYLNKKVVKNDGDVPMYEAEDTHPAIIDPLEWQEVQDEYERRKQYEGKYSCKSVFIGRVYCECCGANYGRRVWNSTNKYKRTVWQCSKKFPAQNGTKKTCPSVHVEERELEQTWLNAWNNALKHRAEVAEVLTEIIAETFDEVDYSGQLAVLWKQREVLGLKLGSGLTNGTDELFAEFSKVERKIRKLTTKAEKQDEEQSALNRRKAEALSFVKLLESQDMPTYEFDEFLCARTLDKIFVNEKGEIKATLRQSDEVERLNLRAEIKQTVNQTLAQISREGKRKRVC